MSTQKSIEAQTGGEVQGLHIRTVRGGRTLLGLSDSKRGKLMSSMIAVLGERAPAVRSG